jgi:hypothetical protein
MRGMWILVCGLLSVGCSNELKGKATASTKESGEFSIKPTECASGERQGFFGVDVREGESGKKIVRLINDPKDGYSVKINLPKSDKALILTKGEQCKKFDVHVEHQNSEINDIKNVRGHIKIECEKGEMKAKANITFANCH